MSQASLSAARKRRAPASVSNAPVGRGQVPVPSAMSPPTSAPSQMNATQGLTLAQVITLVDSRLTVLETHMKRNIETNSQSNASGTVTQDIPSNITEVLDEFNERFEALADELANLKNVVLSLQSYTMDVNKTLLQERIRILGEDQSSAPVTSNDRNWEQELEAGH